MHYKTVLVQFGLLRELHVQVEKYTLFKKICLPRRVIQSNLAWFSKPWAYLSSFCYPETARYPYHFLFFSVNLKNVLAFVKLDLLFE